MMKKHLSWSLLLTFLSVLAAHAQIKSSSYYARDVIKLFPDSIRLEFPNEQAFAVFELKDYKQDHSSIDHFDSLLAEVISYIRKTSASKDFAATPHLANVSFTGHDRKEIEVIATNTNPTKIVITNSQITELLPPGWEIKINKKDCKIYVYGKNLESIEKIVKTDFTLVSSQINSSASQPLGRKSVKARMIIKNGIVEHSDVDIKHPGDFLVAYPAFGFGFVSDTFYPSLSLSVGVIFRDRYGRKNYMIQLTTDYLLLTRKRLDGKTTVGANVGSSLSFAWNFSKNSRNSRWVAVGVGNIDNHPYKTVNDMYFRGHTMRIFASFDIGNNFSLIPELYLTDNVTNKLYGLRMNFTLP